VQVAYRVAERRACRVLGFARSSFRYRSRRDLRAELRVRLRDLATSRVHYGYQRLWVLLRREGWVRTPSEFARLLSRHAQITALHFEQPGWYHAGGGVSRATLVLETGSMSWGQVIRHQAGS
jgi:hypothetical protein